MTAEILVSYAAYEAVLHERDEYRGVLEELLKVGPTPEEVEDAIRDGLVDTVEPWKDARGILEWWSKKHDSSRTHQILP